MGKWASNVKRGGAGMFGTLPPPAAADWTVAPTSPTNALITRVASLPGGADGFGRLLRVSPNGAPIGGDNITVGTTINQGGLTTAVTYLWNIAWYRGSARISEWSDTKTTLQP